MSVQPLPFNLKVKGSIKTNLWSSSKRRGYKRRARGRCCNRAHNARARLRYLGRRILRDKRRNRFGSFCKETLTRNVIGINSATVGNCLGRPFGASQNAINQN